MRTSSTAVVALLLLAAPVFAQGKTDFSSTASGVVGLGKTWDDEGQIGSGPLVGARIDRRLFGNSFLEVSIDNLGHDRSDRFEANGHTTLFAASLVQRFGSANAQPYVLGGVAIAHHTGTAGFPELGLINETSSTDPGFLFGGGIAFPIARRIEIGPEGRFLILKAATDSAPAFQYWVGARVGIRF
jgi:opacity protein-like surface antigen